MDLNKKFRKLQAIVLSLALVLGSIVWPDAAPKAAASVAAPEEGLSSKGILSVSGDTLISDSSSHVKDEYDEYDGYITSITNFDGIYYEVKYTVDASVCTDETEVFNFQPYDTSWGGWQDNRITFGDSELDEETNEYVAYIAVEDIQDSYTGDKEIQGINLSFCAAEPQVTLTGLAILYEKDSDQESEEAVTIWTDETKTSVGHETLQEFSLKDMQAVNPDITFANVSGLKAKVYIHVTKSSPYSRLKIRCGNISTSSFSNKELIGKKNTTFSSNNSPHYIHLGYGTSGGYGSGMGEKESGNYVFNDSSVSKGTDDETAGVRLTRMTTDVEAYIIGIVFTSGSTTYAVSLDEEGNMTSGFDVNAANIESWELDTTDYSPEELDAQKKAEAEAAVENLDEVYEEGLGYAIDACDALLYEDYEEESWDALQAALETACEVYDEGYELSEDATNEEIINEAAEIAERFKVARDELMKVRAALVPVMTTEAGNPKPFRVLSKDEVIAEMGSGINLGNTMDGHSAGKPSETSWQAAKTTPELIKAMHDAGYNTVRVPVTWIDMIDDDNEYAIDEAWMNRVQEIVDYCVDLDMYCIINIHHDGAANHSGPGSDSYAWLNTAATDISYVYEKFAGTWKTIAERFKDYDEHLIFESMNEVTDDHTTDVHYDTEVLNNLNQIYVNTVRSTGSNNTKRWLAITGRFATASEGVTKPADPLEDAGSTTRMMFAVHIYKNMHGATHTYSGTLKTWQSSMSSTYKRVNDLDPEMPIYVGEYGNTQQALSGSPTGYNNIERAMAVEACSAIAKFYGACPVVWDQGAGDYTTAHTETGLHSYWNRVTLVPTYDNMVQGMIRGEAMDYGSMTAGEIMTAIYEAYGHTSTDDSSAAKDVEVTEITDITVEDSLTMTAGERTTLTAAVTPEVNNDVVLWRSADDSVATVYKGLIHAKKSGVTTIYAFSQSGSVEKEISLVVSPSGNETATAITTDEAYYEVEVGETASIVTTLTPADSEDEITYRSSNTAVASVNSNGTITANSPGSTYITISAASGVTTIVKVRVPSVDLKVDVALHAYYNSGDEEGEPITITGDGQYEVSFDASEVGVENINNVVSIYIKDCNASNPVVESAQIRYDKIVVDGTELAIKEDKAGFKSAIKSNGQFDTNDPINGWDGSVIVDSELTTNASDHTISFKNIDNPQKITVTFTIQDMVFFPTSEKENEATQMSIEGENILKMESVGDTVQIPISLVPVDTDSFVTAYSTDSSVAAVDSTALAVDENGMVTLNVTAVGEGTATITAITENGLRLFFAIGVGDVEVTEPTDPTPDGLLGGEEPPVQSEPPVATDEPAATEPAATEPAAPSPSAPAAGGTATPPSILTTTVPVQAPVKGDVVTAGDASYVVADAEAKTVEYKAPAKKNVTSVTIPATIELPENGQMVKYQVTGIAKNAFAKNKKLKSVVIGKNVTKIGANAFKDCKSLKKITIKSKKLKSVGKNAIKNINKKAVIKVPKAELKAYKKLFKKSTGYKKTMKIKKA